MVGAPRPDDHAEDGPGRSQAPRRVLRLAYLVSRYPAVSHAFLQREVAGLRQSGIEVETVSIRPARSEELLTEADRADAASTFTVLPAGPLRLLGAHLRSFASRPHRYLATLWLALKTSSGGARQRLWQLFYFAEGVLLQRHLARAGIRHVHAVQFADAAADVAMLVAELDPGITWSVTVHGPLELLDPERYRLSEKLQRAGLVIAVSEHGRKRLRIISEQDRRIEVVRCGVDSDAFAPRQDPRRDAGATGILCIGRLVSQKGQATLVSAAAELRRRGVDARVTLVGEGPDREWVESKIAQLDLADRVILAGSLGQDRIPSLLAEADVFCLPSVAEGLPVALVEAMATELPVVTTPVMGIPELVEHEVNGLLVPPGDPRSLADALERLLSDGELRRRLGEAGRAKVVADFDVHDHVRRLGELLRETATPAAT